METVQCVCLHILQEKELMIEILDGIKEDETL